LADDLLNAEESFSEAARLATNRWVDATFATRLNDPATGVFVYVCQRLAQDDPAGHLLEEQKGRWILLKVPVEAQEPEVHVFPLSGRTVRREVGDVLQPERFTPDVVGVLKQNSREWAGQYLQEPVPLGGGIIKPHWWRFYVRPGDPRPEGCLVLPDEFEEVAQSWDLSFKDTRTADFVCGGAWGRNRAMKFLLDIVWDRMDFVATKKAIISFSARWPQAHAKWIEDKANGPAIISELQTEISGLIAVQPLGSKEARLHAAAPDVEAGNVVLPHPSIAPWVRRFIDECAAACCGGKHDDAADMTSQAINKMRSSDGGFFKWLKSTTAKQEAARAMLPARDETGLNVVVEAKNPATAVPASQPAAPVEQQATVPFRFADPFGMLKRPARGT
jgi:predicted phage terminase large subunit-like protein